MNIDVDSVWRELELLTETSLSPNAAMSRFLGVCAASHAHPSWDDLAALDYDAGVLELEPWLTRLLTSEPPPPATNAFWVGLCNPLDQDDEPYADFYLSGSDAYDPDDEDYDWACDPSWFPEGRFASSSILKDMYRIAYGPEDGLENDAEWSACLMFAILAIRTLFAKPAIHTLLPACRKARPVVVGFDSGDMHLLGAISHLGWLSSQLRAPVPP